MIKLIHEADDKFSTRGQVGIGMPGFINNQQRTIYTTNIEVVKNKPFVDDLEHAIKRPVLINNDANYFALSEAFAPDLQQYHSLLGIILGTGLGGGIVINQQVIAGANGCAGEIGHIRLLIDALNILGRDIVLIPCDCGALGCCEKYLSGTGFEWLYQYFYQHQLDAKTIIQLYYQGDESAKVHVDHYLELLAAYLGHLIMILDMEVIVIGGGLSNFDVIYQQMPQRIGKYLLKQMTVPRIEKAKYGNSGGTRGAALLCISQK